MIRCNLHKLRSVFILVLLLAIIQLNYSCSGCSPSGRRSLQNINSYETSSREAISRQNPNNKEYEKKSEDNPKVLSLNELYEKYKTSVFLVYTSDGFNNYQGSGFFISKNGLAVSNYHVFQGTSKGLEVIKTLDGNQFKISEVLEKSEDNDYIIFRVNIGNYNIKNPIAVASQEPQIGEDVFAIGNPKGLESTLSKGIVSGFRANNSLIQTTTEITHGSSGGPLLNMRGEVTGITAAGLGEADLNFAVNIKVLKISRFIHFIHTNPDY